MKRTVRLTLKPDNTGFHWWRKFGRGDYAAACGAVNAGAAGRVRTVTLGAATVSCKKCQALLQGYKFLADEQDEQEGDLYAGKEQGGRDDDQAGEGRSGPPGSVQELTGPPQQGEKPEGWATVYPPAAEHVGRGERTSVPDGQARPEESGGEAEEEA